MWFDWAMDLVLSFPEAKRKRLVIAWSGGEKYPYLFRKNRISERDTESYGSCPHLPHYAIQGFNSSCFFCFVLFVLFCFLTESQNIPTQNI